MNNERNAEKSALNWDLSLALEKWQKYPDGWDQMFKMQHLINHGSKFAPITTLVMKESLKNINREESFLTLGVVRTYGKEDGQLIEFDSSTGIKVRVGDIKHKGYLFLEKDGQRLGYIRPGLVAGIKIK